MRQPRGVPEWQCGISSDLVIWQAGPESSKVRVLTDQSELRNTSAPAWKIAKSRYVPVPDRLNHNVQHPVQQIVRHGGDGHQHQDIAQWAEDQALVTHGQA